MSHQYRLSVDDPTEEELTTLIRHITQDVTNLVDLKALLFPPKPIKSDSSTESWCAEWKVEPLKVKKCDADWAVSKVSIKPLTTKKRGKKKASPKKRKAGA